MKKVLIILQFIVSITAFCTLNMTTLVSIEDGAFDVNEINIVSISKGKIQSELNYLDFKQGIQGENEDRYYVNNDRYLHGNGRLSNGDNLLFITLKTDENVFHDTLMLSIDKSITGVYVNCLIGLSKDSVSYIKKIEVRRSVGNCKKISLKPKYQPALNEPILFVLKNKSSNLVYGNTQRNHFLGTVMEEAGLGFIRISPYRFCIPENVAEPLKPNEEVECFATNKKNCESFIIEKYGNYLFEIFVNKEPFDDVIPQELIEKHKTHFKIIDQYRVSCEFSIADDSKK